MKKSLLVMVVLVFGFFINADLIGATVPSSDADYGCIPGSPYSPITGEPCFATNDSEIAGYVFSGNLSIGSRGKEVKVLQKILKDAGYFFGKVDGKYGRMTARSLGDMQEDYDLTRTEKLDSATRAFFAARYGQDGMILNIVTPSDLAHARIGTYYGEYINTVGVESYYEWTVTSGTLPPGIGLNSSICGAPPCGTSGTLSGVPTVSGIYNFTVRVRTGSGPLDSSSQSVSKQFTIVVESELTSQTPTIISILPAGCSSTSGWSSVTGGSCAESRSSANSGDTIYLYGSGFSPSNTVFLNDTDGSRIGFSTTYVSPSLLKFPLIPSYAGATLTPGAYIFQVMKNQDGPTYYSNGVGMDVNSSQNSQLVITTSSPLYNAKVGNSYSVTLNVLPDSMPTNQLNWTITSGTLPPGVYLYASDIGQVISGIPTQAGTYTFDLRASYNTPSTPSGTTTKKFTLVVDPADVATEIFKIYSPGNGEEWVRPSSRVISWYDSVDSFHDIKLVPNQICKAEKCPSFVYHAPYLLGRAKGDTFNWNVGTTEYKESIPDGEYTIEVCRTEKSVCAKSDGNFRIFTVSLPTVPAEISVVRNSSSSYGAINVGAKGAELFRINITANGQNANIKKLYFNLNGYGLRYISNIQAYVDGVSVGTLSDLVNTDSWYYTGLINTSNILVPVGSTKTVVIRGDVASDVWAGVSSCQGCTQGMYMILNDIFADDKYTAIGLPVYGNDVYIPFTAPIGKNNIGSMLGANALGGVSSQSKNNSSTSESLKPSTKKFHFTKYMDLGSYGDEVMELQKVLSARGYYTAKIDHSFGAGLKAALVKFQADNGLKADGIFGYEVRTLLNK